MKQVGKSKRTEKATRPGKAKPGAKKRRMDTAPGRQYAALPFRYLDGLDYLPLAAASGVRPHVKTYPLIEANQALADLRAGAFTGAAVLLP